MMYFFAFRCPYMPIYRRNVYEGTKISVTFNFVVCVCERWLRWSAADSANMIPALLTYLLTYLLHGAESFLRS